MSKVWKTVSSTVVYSGRWLQLKHDEVILPNGSKGEYDYISKKDAILIIPEYKSKFILVKQYRYTIKKTLVEFPQGGCNKGESPADAAIRESEEELGLIPLNLRFLGRLDIAKGCSNQGMHFFHASKFIKGKQNLENTEKDIRTELLTRKSLEKMIIDGKITDSPTISAYGLYRLIRSDK